MTPPSAASANAMMAQKEKKGTAVHAGAWDCKINLFSSRFLSDACACRLSAAHARHVGLLRQESSQRCVARANLGLSPLNLG
jgi:hypothetical protein